MTQIAPPVPFYVTFASYVALVVVTLALALMFGDGTSAYFSLRLGEKKQKEAEKGVASGIIAGAIV